MRQRVRRRVVPVVVLLFLHRHHRHHHLRRRDRLDGARFAGPAGAPRGSRRRDGAGTSARGLAWLLQPRRLAGPVPRGDRAGSRARALRAARRGLDRPAGGQFWDATAACCNFTGTPVDDVAYLGGLIEEAFEERPIDPGRVYVLGHSNGGFMAYRLACERAEQVTAVAVLAGADQLDEQACTPSEPVSVLHLHGTDDQVVAYDGGAFVAIFAEDQVDRSKPARAYPGAIDTVARWASRNGCDVASDDGTALDLDTGLDGAETTITAHGGCAAGVEVQLDTIEGGGHIPSLDHETFGAEVLDWLLRQAR